MPSIIPHIDDPPPPLTWREVLIGVAVFVAIFVLAVSSSGSFTQGIIAVAFLLAILSLVAVHQMRSRQDQFLDRVAKHAADEIEREHVGPNDDPRIEARK